MTQIKTTLSAAIFSVFVILSVLVSTTQIAAYQATDANRDVGVVLETTAGLPIAQAQDQPPEDSSNNSVEQRLGRLEAMLEQLLHDRQKRDPNALQGEPGEAGNLLPLLLQDRKQLSASALQKLLDLQDGQHGTDITVAQEAAALAKAAKSAAAIQRALGHTGDPDLLPQIRNARQIQDFLAEQAIPMTRKVDPKSPGRLPNQSTIKDQIKDLKKRLDDCYQQREALDTQIDHLKRLLQKLEPDSFLRK